MLPSISERRACRVINQPRPTQRRTLKSLDDEESLTRDIIKLAVRFGRYVYRRITALLRDLGWQVNHKRVERIWRREGLKVPMKQPKRGRLWLNDGSCIRLKPERKGHVWAYDFVACRTEDGRAVRMLTVIDEYTRECLAIRTARRKAQGRTAKPGDLLFVEGGRGTDRTMAKGVQHDPTAQLTWIPAAGA